MSGMISLTSNKNNNNVSVSVSNTIKTTANPYESIETEAKTTNTEPITKNKVNNEEAYKLIIEILVQHRYTKRDGQYVFNNEDLLKLIEYLYGEPVNINVEELNECFGTIYKIISIIAKSQKDNQINVKYDRNDIYELLRSFNISTKYTF